MNAKEVLDELLEAGNLRFIPADRSRALMVDFSANDYLGLASRDDLRDEFMTQALGQNLPLTSSASRLLAPHQDVYKQLEEKLEELYGRPALLFNSGYHANTGLIAALSDKNTIILADRLVHASIIDGIMLSKCEWNRFKHNDIEHLERLIDRSRPDGDNILVIVESIYSMDGDSAPMEELLALKQRHPGLLLYVDEAHAVGVSGPHGLGLAAASSNPAGWDVVVGTFGKALASMGAFAVMSEEVKQLAVNRARSFIFSTALPPLNAAWSLYLVERMASMDQERRHVAELSKLLARELSEITGKPQVASHIQPLIVGDARRAVELSRRLEEEGLKVLPIRTPTVPPGTERLRVSLSAAMTRDDIERLSSALKRML